MISISQFFQISFLLSIVMLWGCQKQEQLINTETENLPKKAFELADPSGKNRVLLNFYTENPELLDQINPQNFSLEAISDQGGNTETSISASITEEANPIPFDENGILIRLKVLKTENPAIGLGLTIKSGDSTGQPMAKSSTHFSYNVYTENWARRIELTNYSPNKILASFYHHNGNDVCYRTTLGCLDVLGAQKTLPQNYKWFYYHCNRQVALQVNTYGKSYNFKYVIKSNCQ